MYEMLMIQNAQMHQMIMQQLMLSNLARSPVATPPAAAAAAATEANGDPLTALDVKDLIDVRISLAFLAKIYAIARPSVVCNARAPYSGGSKFRQYFYGIRYLGHPLTSTENFTEIVPREPLHRGS